MSDWDTVLPSVQCWLVWHPVSATVSRGDTPPNVRYLLRWYPTDDAANPCRPSQSPQSERVCLATVSTYCVTRRESVPNPSRQLRLRRPQTLSWSHLSWLQPPPPPPTKQQNNNNPHPTVVAENKSILLPQQQQQPAATATTTRCEIGSECWLHKLNCGKKDLCGPFSPTFGCDTTRSGLHVTPCRRNRFFELHSLSSLLYECCGPLWKRSCFRHSCIVALPTRKETGGIYSALDPSQNRHSTCGGRSIKKS